MAAITLTPLIVPRKTIPAGPNTIPISPIATSPSRTSAKRGFEDEQSADVGRDYKRPRSSTALSDLKNIPIQLLITQILENDDGWSFPGAQSSWNVQVNDCTTPSYETFSNTAAIRSDDAVLFDDEEPPQVSLPSLLPQPPVFAVEGSSIASLSDTFETSGTSYATPSPKPFKVVTSKRNADTERDTSNVWREMLNARLARGEDFKSAPPTQMPLLERDVRRVQCGTPKRTIFGVGRLCVPVSRYVYDADDEAREALGLGQQQDCANWLFLGSGAYTAKLNRGASRAARQPRANASEVSGFMSPELVLEVPAAGRRVTVSASPLAVEYWKAQVVAADELRQKAKCGLVAFSETTSDVYDLLVEEQIHGYDANPASMLDFLQWPEEDDEDDEDDLDEVAISGSEWTLEEGLLGGSSFSEDLSAEFDGANNSQSSSGGGWINYEFSQLEYQHLQL